MNFKADEIASVLREEIVHYRRQMDRAQVGRVLEVGDGIAQIFGLSAAMAGEMLEFDNGAMGQVFNLEESSVGAVIYGDYRDIREGQGVRGTGRLLAVPVGEQMLGRVVDPLGRPIDGAGAIHADKTRPVDFAAPGIAQRQPVTEPLYTGVKAIDAMMPIGRGQRELIIGDRKTGKTALAIDAIINQADRGVACVYVAIGQKDSTVADVVETLRAHGAMDYTTIVSASSCDPAPLQYIAPYSGCSIAEHFMYESRQPTLVVYDDLTKQAAAYRQISLLLRRPPGREAYPGDVFYLHSRLLERACKLSDEQGGGSMTALPICETQEGEVSAYIPTNLISITDGQIYLEPSLFFAGIRPAVNVGISVSRVGYKAAPQAVKAVAGGLRLDLAAYRELETFAQLGVELDAATQRRLERGERMVRLLTQGQYQPRAITDQVIAIFAATQGLLDDLPLEEVAHFEQGLPAYVKESYADFYAELDGEKTLDDARVKRLRFIANEYRHGPYEEQRKQRRKQAAAAARAAKGQAPIGPVPPSVQAAMQMEEMEEMQEDPEEGYDI